MFVTLSDGSVRNTYGVRLRNKHGEPRMFGIHVSGDLGLGLSLEGTPYHAVEVAASETLTIRAYVTAPAGREIAQIEESPIRFWVEDNGNGERAYQNTIFNGKGS